MVGSRVQKTVVFYYSEVFAQRSQNWLWKALLDTAFLVTHTFFARNICLLSLHQAVSAL